MSIADHREYFERRRSESVERAERASDLALTHVYRQFAAHYTSALAQEGERQLYVVGAHRRRHAK